jgi:hypothetical protein
MRIDPKDSCVREENKVHLRQWPTNMGPAYESRKYYKRQIGIFNRVVLVSV